MFPNIYESLDKKSHYPGMLVVCYIVTMIIYGGMSVMGYIIYGTEAKQEITLNFDRGVLSKIAIWLTIINPLSKSALIINPGKFYQNRSKFYLTCVIPNSLLKFRSFTDSKNFRWIKA